MSIINRVEAFYRLESLLQHKLACDLDTVARGNLAMAVNAMKDQTESDQLYDSLERCMTNAAGISDGFYRIIRWVYRDWTARVSENKPEAYRMIIEQLWRDKQAAGNRKMLKNFVLIREFKDYPDFFQSLSVMEDLVKTGKE